MKVRTVFVALVVAVLALVGCQAAESAPAGGAGGEVSGSAIDGSGDLDAVSALALGTLNLEGTSQAVSAEQAEDLLPLWQMLQAGEVQSAAERDAVLAQIEAAMSEAQVSAIAEMRLTQQDAQSWMMDQEPTGAQAASAPEGMSAEQLAGVRAQRSQAGGLGSGMSERLARGVVVLLSQRAGMEVDGPEGSARPTSIAEPAAVASTPEALSAVEAVEAAAFAPPGEVVAQAAVVASGPGSSADEPAVEAVDEQAVEGAGDAQPASDAGPKPGSGSVTYTVQRGNTLAAIAQAYGVTVGAIVEANGLQNPDAIQVGQELVIPDPVQIPVTVPLTASPADEGAVTAVETVPYASPAPALKQLVDTDPGPPLTIEVSANRATQDPLVEESQAYLVTGIVRNDGDQTYAVSAIHVTFYDASGFRGTFYKYPLVPGGEWIWHGRTEAEFASLLLAPGEEWPFTVEITAQNMASFLIHPDAVATERQSVPVELSDVRLVDEGTGYLRITGTASNGNSFAVQNVTVSGVLLDEGGQIVGMGSTYVLEEDIASGESVRFDLRVQESAFASYRLYAQAEGDLW